MENISNTSTSLIAQYFRNRYDILNWKIDVESGRSGYRAQIDNIINWRPKNDYLGYETARHSRRRSIGTVLYLKELDFKKEQYRLSDPLRNRLNIIAPNADPEMKRSSSAEFCPKNLDNSNKNSIEGILKTKKINLIQTSSVDSSTMTADASMSGILKPRKTRNKIMQTEIEPSTRIDFTSIPPFPVSKRSVGNIFDDIIGIQTIKVPIEEYNSNLKSGSILNMVKMPQQQAENGIALAENVVQRKDDLQKLTSFEIGNQTDMESEPTKEKSDGNKDFSKTGRLENGDIAVVQIGMAAEDISIYKNDPKLNASNEIKIERRGSVTQLIDECINDIENSQNSFNKNDKEKDSRLIKEAKLKIENNSKIYQDTEATKQKIKKELKIEKDKLDKNDQLPVDVQLDVNIGGNSNIDKTEKSKEMKSLKPEVTVPTKKSYDEQELPEFFTRLGLQSPAEHIRPKSAISQAKAHSELQSTTGQVENSNVTRIRPKTTASRQPLTPQVISRDSSFCGSIDSDLMAAHIRAQTAPAQSSALKSILKMPKESARFYNQHPIIEQNGYAASYKKSLIFHIDPRLFRDFEVPKVFGFLISNRFLKPNVDQNTSGWISRASTPLQSNSRGNSRVDYHNNCTHHQQNEYINPYLPPTIPLWQSHYSIQYQYPDYYQYYPTPQIPQISYIQQCIDEPYTQQYIDEPYESYEPCESMPMSLPESKLNSPKKRITFSKTVKSKYIKPLLKKKEPEIKNFLVRKSITRKRHAKDVVSQKPKGDFRTLYDNIHKGNSMKLLPDEK
jgi:hypothetical protein